MMLYLICSLLVAAVAFFVGGWASSWQVYEIAPIPWVLICLVAGFLGCASLIPDPNAPKVKRK